MRLFGRKESTEAPTDVAANGNGSADAPFAGYDKLNAKQVSERLRGLTQVQLEAVENYERSHKERPVVLNKLKYMRRAEPIEGYDTLESGQIAEALVGADSERVKAVRDYERRFRHRRDVLDETARVLPSSPASAKEDASRKEKHDRTRAGIRKSPGAPPA